MRISTVTASAALLPHAFSSTAEATEEDAVLPGSSMSFQSMTPSVPTWSSR